MQTDIIVESLSVLLYTVVAILLTAAGLVVEYASLQHFGSGEVVAALWLAVIGCLLLYAGAYGIGYKKVVSQFVR